MLRRMKVWLAACLVCALVLLGGVACDTAPAKTTSGGQASAQAATALVDRDGYYYDVEHVTLYLEAYDELPPNYLTKKEARALGWQGGSVERYQEGAAIGGDVFGNREGSLPSAAGRTYYECDINTKGARSRGPERLVYSNDGVYYYTPDHYETFDEVTVSDEGKVVVHD